jgi:hypothetical protein
MHTVGNIKNIFGRHLYVIPNYSQQDTTFLDLFISTNAVHVSGIFSAHHQGHITSTVAASSSIG